MKFIYNKYIPFGEFGMMNILGLVFTKVKEEAIALCDKIHEAIHTRQQMELLGVSAIVSLALCNIFASWLYLAFLPIIPFAVYVFAFLLEMAIPPYHNVRDMFVNGNWREGFKKMWMDAYYDNCFEREAFANQHNVEYLAVRPIFAVLKYVLKRKERK